MTTTIGRHSVDEGRAAEFLGFCTQELGDNLASARRDARALWWLYITERAHSSWCTITDPLASDVATWEAVVRAAEAGMAHFAVATGPLGTAVHAVIGSETATWPAGTDLTHIDAVTWLELLNLVIVSRDEDRTKALCAIDVRRLHSPKSNAPPYAITWVRAWQALWRGDVETATELVLQTIEETRDDRIPIGARRHVDLILAPQLTLLRHYLNQDEGRFAEALAAGVKSHKQFWSMPERAHDSDGLVAWGLLALAVLGVENDWALPIESGYLPANLLLGSWVGSTRHDRA